MAESDPPRLMLQIKAKVTHAILLAGEAGSDKGGALTVPPGRLSIATTGEVQSASPMLAWLGQSRLEGRVVVNTETGDLFLTLYLED